MCEKYNGWTNYETWNIALWLGNEEGTQRYWEQMAHDCMSENDGDPLAAAGQLSQILRDEINDANPLVDGCSMYADLLGAAISAANWYEIAEHYVADCGYEPEEVEEEESEV